MKICVAQTRSVAGNIERNVARHREFVETAVSHRANLIIFPELSLTGYEPTLAQFNLPTGMKVTLYHSV